MDERPSSFLTTPVAILLGSFIVAIAILMHGGIIKIGSNSPITAQPQPTTAAQPTQRQAPQISLDTIKALFNDKNLVFGDKNAKNLLVEIADPSCPYCHIASGHDPELNKQDPRFTLVADGGSYVAPVPEMKKLVDEGKAAFVYIYSPGHGAGDLGTAALYCANEQNKFWPVHDLLMSNQGYNFMNNNKLKFDPSSADLSNGYKKATDQDLNNMVDFLQNTSINKDQLSSCLLNKKYVNKLVEDSNTASRLGVTGTPGFFVNTTTFPGAFSWKDMASAVK